MPASQAGRHRFDPDRPLQLFLRKYGSLSRIAKRQPSSPSRFITHVSPKIGGSLSPSLAFSRELEGERRTLVPFTFPRGALHDVPDKARRACSAGTYTWFVEEAASHIGATAQFKGGRAPWTLSSTPLGYA